MATKEKIVFDKYEGEAGGAEKDTTIRWMVGFEDKQQDFLKWGLNRYGFVVTSEPFQTEIWAGTWCDLERAGTGKTPPIVYPARMKMKKDARFTVLKYKIESIEKVNLKQYRGKIGQGRAFLFHRKNLAEATQYVQHVKTKLKQKGACTVEPTVPHPLKGSQPANMRRKG